MATTTRGIHPNSEAWDGPPDGDSKEFMRQLDEIETSDPRRAAHDHLTSAAALLDSGELDAAMLANDLATDALHEAREAMARDERFARIAPLTSAELEIAKREVDEFLAEFAEEFEVKR